MTSAPSARDFDVVLFGATGFVGVLTAEFLAENAPAGARIALAGRSADKLEKVKARAGAGAAHWQLVTVDASDPEQVRALARRTVALATTVGPFMAYGKEVVLACAQEGTNYCDLTGEALFARWSLDHADEAAKASGARIVHSVGFDSVPSDLGVLVTADRAAADGAGQLTQTVLRVRSLSGGMSGGTIDSARKTVIVAREDATARRTLSDPYGLSPDRQAEPRSNRKQRSALERLTALVPVERNAEGHWLGPFLMASYNTRIVRLSNALQGWRYGRDFRYREVTDFGAKPTGAAAAVAMSLGLAGGLAGLSFAPTRFVLDKVLPAPGEGPSPEAMAKGKFVMDIDADTTSGATYRTRVSANYDPGYTGTAVMMGEAVLALAFDQDKLPQAAGVLTPATGIGEDLVVRLRAHGFVFDTAKL